MPRKYAKNVLSLLNEACKDDRIKMTENNLVR